MPNHNKSAIPVLGGELHDLFTELRKAFTSVWVIVEPSLSPNAALPLQVRVVCQKYSKVAPERHLSRSKQIGVLETPNLDEVVYGLLWAAIDQSIAEGYLPAWGDDAD